MTYLRTIREKKGYKQNDVAKALGLSKQVYSNYELGKRQPDYELLLKIAEFLDTSVDMLLTGRGVDEMPKPADKEKAPTADTVDELTEILTGLMSDFTDKEVREIRDYVRYLRWKRYRAEV